MKEYDVIVIGGGLAGLTTAIHLSKFKQSVLVIERHKYPRHKVCGEYVSNEVLPYLAYLGVDFDAFKLPQINNLLITTPKANEIKQKLPLGGFGISRFTFDDLLYKKAMSLGASFVFEKAEHVEFKNETYQVKTRKHHYQAKLVVGSFGKRSNLDQHFNRAFTKKPAHWVGIKAHYKHPSFPAHKVELHNFDGGYCGLSLTEKNEVNLCYLARYDSFKKYKDIQEFNECVLSKNKHLAAFFENANLLFEKHLAIAQISFAEKQNVENNILMLGDSAGLIHPLCGNGMAMAIHSAKLASEEILAYQHHQSKELLFSNYSRKWKNTFESRMKFGRIFQHVLMKPNLTNLGIAIGSKMPKLVQKMIQQTHGKPIECS